MQLHLGAIQTVQQLILQDLTMDTLEISLEEFLLLIQIILKQFYIIKEGFLYFFVFKF
jgi:hypothetical protein